MYLKEYKNDLAIRKKQIISDTRTPRPSSSNIHKVERNDLKEGFTKSIKFMGTTGRTIYFIIY